MGSRAQIIKLWQDIRASYWFLPTLLAITSILLAELMLFIDQHADALPFALPKGLRDTQVEGARSLMAIISQSIFGVAGVMFSMTMVAVSFASSNFGPRLVGNFMRDRGNQWSLGILIATFTYALLITRGIQSPTADDAQISTDLFVPHFSIAVALILTFVSVFTVIYFVHHIPETINVSNITAALGARLVTSIKSLIDDHENDDSPDAVLTDLPPDQNLTLGRSGYIQALEKARLTTLAEENDLTIHVPPPVGSFVTEHTTIMRVWGPVPDKQVVEDMRDCFAVGNSRTEHQNLLFIADQLVEMIARALSPGVNDPFTSINCLNWVHAAIVAAANHKQGLVARNTGPVHTGTISFEDLLEATFGACYPYTQTDELADRHVKYLIGKMPDEITNPQHRATLNRFMDRLTSNAD